MNEAKVEALIDHINEGGGLEPEDLAEKLSLSPRSLKSMENYVAEVADRLELDLEVGGVNPLAQEPGEEEEDSDEEEEDDSEDEDEDDEEADEEEAESEPEPEPELAPKKEKKKKSAAYRFFLNRSDGTSVELQRVSTSSGGNIVTFQEVQPTDVVQLMLKGEVVEVDIIPLRKAVPTNMSEHNITNEKLLQLALAAKP